MELEKIKGLGKKRIEILNEKGISSSDDLVYYFPKTYFDLESEDIFAEDGKYKLIRCEVVGDVKVSRIRRDFSYSAVECIDKRNYPFKAIWYNQPYIKSAIKNGDVLYLYGKNSNTKHNYFVVSTYRNKNKIDPNIKFLPVYKSFKNLGQSIIRSSIEEALKSSSVSSIFPDEFEKTHLLPINDAIKNIHNPTDINQLKQSKERVDFEKILPVIKLNNDLSNKKNNPKHKNYSGFSQYFDEFCVFLPYKLTSSQLHAIDEIIKDLSGPSLSRLIQGDVGSGKTIVALIVSYLIIKNGYSVIFMAPTEVLANQHYNEAKKYFDKLNARVSLLTSSTKQKERSTIIENFNNNPTLLIGTQSCLSDEIDVRGVGLMIIDEQHKFGVKQRSKIINKSKECDLIMLSATPIPRSLSIVYYGGLDITTLEKPPFEKKIQTNLVPFAKEKGLWDFIDAKINNGSKVYVVCANIDDSDDDCYQGLSVNSMYKFLCNRFSSEKVVMAHGRLDSIEEQKVIRQFNESKSILVSTTIIEVGVDNPAADIMVIVSPEKFGLATLHQLRGRIGRAGQESYCFCLTKNISESSIERIKYFKEHLNGFEIAEFDYNFRGAGDVLSTKQHGRLDGVFDSISLDTLKKANELFDQLSREYKNTDFLLAGKEVDCLKDIGLN